MNQIRLYMNQIPSHMKTIVKILTSKASARYTQRMVTTSMNHIERITKTCIDLASKSEMAFQSVLALLDEVIAITLVTKGENEKEERLKQIQLNVTHTMQADLKQQNEERRRHYEEMRASVRKAQDEYSDALRKIPTGFKALCYDLGRASISALKTLVIASANPLAIFSGQIGSSDDSMPSMQSDGSQSQGSKSGKQAYGIERVLNYVGNFAQSIRPLAGKLSDDKKDVTSKELEGYKVVFQTFGKMLATLPDNPIKEKASALVQRASESIDARIEDENATIGDDLQAIANDVKPFIAAQQLSQSNTRALAADAGPTDSSQNELFNARLSQTRLEQAEKRLDSYHSAYMAAMDQMRSLTAKIAELDHEVFDLKQVIEMLKEAFILLGQLREQWFKIVQFFTDFSVQVGTGFKENVVPYLDTLRSGIADEETLEVDRKVNLDLLNGETSVNFYREAYFLYSLSRTYFYVSNKYLLPRLGALTNLLAATTDDQRLRLLTQLGDDITTVQDEVQELVEKRREHYERLIRKKQAEINRRIDQAGADGSEEDDIAKGRNILENQDDEFSKETD